LSGPPAWPDSPGGGVLGDGRLACATHRPEEIDALCRTVRDQVAQGHAIYPQGGKTSLDYGGAPGRPGVAVDTTALCQLIDYPFADMTITVQAGTTLSALRAILAGQRQRVLVDAPFPEQATLGGIYATNTTGPRRYGAGRPRDQIIGVSFVTSEGASVKGGGRVVKNVAGYDFPKLLTGSMGTLGIITQMTLKVRPIPEASAIAWATFPDAQDLAAALGELNTSGTRPIALEVLNAPAAQVVARGLDLPTNHTVLAVGFEDNAHSVRWQVERLKDELRRSDILIVDGQPCDSVWDALTEFQAQAGGPFSFVANVRPSSVVSLLEHLDPARWWVQAHAGSGIVHGHAHGEWTLDEARREIEPLRKLAVEAGGNLILPRCPTGWKDQLRVWGEARADWKIAERLKAALDPHNALNPGRFLDLGSQNRSSGFRS
jgi:glycolate oxidase FAD binding subunit